MRAATMTVDPELFSSVTKFNNLLRAGMKAHLVMECENGHARVKLELLLRPSPHLDQREQHPQARAQRIATPARLRRRARRAEARARQASEDAAVQDADSIFPPGSAGAAVTHDPPPVKSPQHQAVLGGVVPQPPPGSAGGGAGPHPPLGPGGGGIVPSPPPGPGGGGAVPDPPPGPGGGGAVPHPLQDLSHHLPQHRAEEVAHHLPQHKPLLTVEEAAHHHLPHKEVPNHHQHVQTVEETALHQPPDPAQAAAESFPPLSYIPKEVFLPALAPLQVSPVWPAYYQQEDVYSSPHLQVQPDYALPYPPLTALSPVSPAYSHPPQSQPAGQYADQVGLVSDQKNRRKKKRKSGRRQGGQLGDSPEAPASSDPAAIAQYREDYDAYLMREYGDSYTQFKASNPTFNK